MNLKLSIWSIYEQVKHDVIKDIKKYVAIFSLQGVLLFLLSLFAVFLIPKDIFITFIQQKRLLLTDIVFQQQFSPFSVLFILLIAIFSKLIPFIFHVGLLNFIYTLKTKSISLSIQEFFSKITIKKIIRVFFVYAILLLFFGTLLFLFFMPFILFSLFNIATTGLITLLVFLFLLFLVFPTITLLVRFFIAPFVIFEFDATVFNSIQKSFYRSKGYGVSISLIWIVTLLIALITGIILSSPFLFFFGYSLKSLFSGEHTSFFVLTYLEQGYIVLVSLFFAIFSYIFHTFWSIVFFLINGEIYKRLSKKQENHVISTERM